VVELRGKGGVETAVPEAKRGTDLRQHVIEIGLVLVAANEASGRLVLWHGATIDPHELDPLASRRNEKVLDGLKLFAIAVGLSHFHPAMGDRQNLLDMCPADHLLIGDDHLHESTRVPCAQLLEKGQIRAGESAEEVSLDHPEPTRDTVCWRSNRCPLGCRPLRRHLLGGRRLRGGWMLLQLELTGFGRCLICGEIKLQTIIEGGCVDQVGHRHLGGCFCDRRHQSAVVLRRSLGFGFRLVHAARLVRCLVQVRQGPALLAIAL
jgi:hypothetical protein